MSLAADKPLRIVSQLATEYGVPERTVREICGDMKGSLGDENWLERVACMRSKLEMQGFVQIMDVSQSNNKDVIPEERGELRVCTFCEEFLEEDDPGEALHHDEEGADAGVICRKCTVTMVRY